MKKTKCDERSAPNEKKQPLLPPVLLNLVDPLTFIDTMEALLDWWKNPEGKPSRELLAEAIKEVFIVPLGQLRNYEFKKMLNLQADRAFFFNRSSQILNQLRIGEFQKAAVDLYCAVINGDNELFSYIENLEKYWIEFQNHWNGRLREIMLVEPLINGACCKTIAMACGLYYCFCVIFKQKGADYAKTISESQSKPDTAPASLH